MLIGVSDPYHNIRLLCKLIYSNYITMCNISTKKMYNTYNKKKNITLTYIALYIKLITKKDVPSYIKINRNIIPLLYHESIKKYNIILAIVNFYEVNNYKQVLEVIEISKLNGVEHIVIYVTSSTQFIKSMLFYYLKSDFVELVPFCFNQEIKYVHEYGQIEKINDVIYRYMNNTRYIIFNDVDEIILPLKTHNYLKLLTMMDNQTSDIYLFKSKLFPYFSNIYDSAIKKEECCVVKIGYEKYIIGNLFKFDILVVHNYFKSFLPIKTNIVNVTYGYVRHTRYKGKMCKTDSTDRSLEYLEKHLNKIYKKFDNIFNNNSAYYYYGRKSIY